MLNRLLPSAFTPTSFRSSYRLFFRRLVKFSDSSCTVDQLARRSCCSYTSQTITKKSRTWYYQGRSGGSSSSSSNHQFLKMGAAASGLLLLLYSSSDDDDNLNRRTLFSNYFLLKRASMFTWKEDRITDEELEELLKEFILIETIKERAAASTSSSTTNPAEEDNESYCKPESTNGVQQPETNQIEPPTSTPSAPLSLPVENSFMAVSCLQARASPSNSTSNGDQEWEEVIKQPHFYVWRKAVNNSSLYEYKVFGSFFDISAYAFYAVQRDLEFRKQWDKLVVKLDIVEVEPTSGRETPLEIEDSALEIQDFHQHHPHQNKCPSKKDDSNQTSADVDDTGNELVHWIMKYPYPMKSREYLFLRRSRVDYARSTIATVSRSVPYPEIPETDEHVRVYDYISQMVIRPHSTTTSESGNTNEGGGDFHALGFDYLLTYFDDTRAAFPSAAYNWMASRGVPDFVEKLHQAALHLVNTGGLPPPPERPFASQTVDGFSLFYLKSNCSQ